MCGDLSVLRDTTPPLAISFYCGAAMAGAG